MAAKKAHYKARHPMTLLKKCWIDTKSPSLLLQTPKAENVSKNIDSPVLSILPSYPLLLVLHTTKVTISKGFKFRCHCKKGNFKERIVVLSLLIIRNIKALKRGSKRGMAD